VPTRRIDLVLATAAVAFVVFACWIVGGWGGPAITGMVTALGSLGFSTFALCCATRVALVARGRRRWAWGAMAIGLLAWVLGDVTGLYHHSVLGAEPPIPSVGDIADLILPVALSITWSLSGPARRPFSGLRQLVDGVIVASALFLVAWVMLVRDLFAHGGHFDSRAVVSLAHPLVYSVSITMSLLVLLGAPQAHRGTIGLVTAGLIAVAAGECSEVYFNIHARPLGAVAVIEWNVGLLLIGAGALSALRTARPETAERDRIWTLFWLPYVPLPFAAVIGYFALARVPGAPPILIGAGVLVGAALIRQFTVLVDNRKLLETVAAQALRDPLTGLANRLLFTDRLTHAMQLRERDGREISVLSLDLDDFKLVNDNLGHHQGDVLLKAVADRLQSVVPTGETVARLGGDEFAVLIEGGPDLAADVAQRAVEAFDKPFFLDHEEVYIHPSVGLAAAPSPADGTISDDELLKRADLAMYTAKRAGIGGFQSFTSDMRHLDSAELRTSLSASGRRSRTPIAGIRLLGQLRRAIDEGGLSLVYQPKISLATGGIVGVEALVRWHHSELGLLMPNQFLPLVRQNGLMGAVTKLVIDRAIRDGVTWYDAADCEVPVAINLFAPSLTDMSLPDDISKALMRGGLPATALSVEITEHLLLANIGRAGTVIERLRAIGLRIAIDDFGSGYSTMSYLRDLHIDELKLDRQFIAPIMHSERATAIVRSVIDLAHTLGIACVAEGVEDVATANRLRDYGCDIAQGHYFSRPLEAEVLRARCQLDRSSGPAIFPITS
jgi:diguanylate cyclase (GGDEF)-like protein